MSTGPHTVAHTVPAIHSDDAAMPVTAPQYGMWAGQQLDPASASFWTAEAVELVGELDVTTLQRAIDEALRDCDALHMRYRVEDGQLVQRLDAGRAIDRQRLDFSGVHQGSLLAHGWMRRDLLQPADLEHGPLFATAVIRIGRQQHLWYLRAHHIALDGYAYLLLIHRVAQLYSAYCVGTTPEPGRDWSLRAVVDEETAYRASPQRTLDAAFWRAQLAGTPTPPTLAAKTPPCDNTRSQRWMLAPSTQARWQVAARACGVDWAAWLVAAIAAWLYARSGEREVSLGLLVMNRLGSAALGVPCMAMNVVPLWLRVDPDAGFDALAREVAAAMRRMRPHARYNYEQLRVDMGLEGSHAQLYGPVVNLMPFDRGFVFAGLRSRAIPVSVGSVEDLDITVSPLADGVRFDIEANPRAYDATTLRSHHEALLAITEAAVAQPLSAVAELVQPWRSEADALVDTGAPVDGLAGGAAA